MMINGNKPGSQTVPETDAQQETNEVPEQATDALTEQAELNEVPEQATDALTEQAEISEIPEKATDALAEQAELNEIPEQATDALAAQQELEVPETGTDALEQQEQDDLSGKVPEVPADSTVVEKSEIATKALDAIETGKHVSETKADEVGKMKPSSNQEVPECNPSKDGSPAITAVPVAMKNQSPVSDDISRKESEEAVSVKSELADVNTDALDKSTKPLVADPEVVSKQVDSSNKPIEPTSTSDITKLMKPSEESAINIPDSTSNESEQCKALKTSNALPQKDLPHSQSAPLDSTAAALSDAMSKLLLSPDTSAETVSDASLESPVTQTISVPPSNVECQSPMDLSKTPFNSLSQSPKSAPLDISESSDEPLVQVKSIDVANLS